MKHRLAVLQSHVICYHGPLFRKLAEHPSIDLTVYYCCPDFGLVEGYDAEIGRPYKWDTPVLEGYRYRILRNCSPVAGRGGFWSFVNPGIVWPLVAGRHDAVMIHGYRLASEWMGFAGAWVSRTPVMFRGEMGERPKNSRCRQLLKDAILRPLFLATRACLAVSSSAKRVYEQLGVDDTNIFMTPYAVDNTFFMNATAEWRPRRTEVLAEFGLAPALPVILQTSKLIPRKRPLDLIQAFERLERPASLLFVGDGELRPALTAYVRERRIANVFFAGFRNQGELPACYAAADVFVLPSAHDIFGVSINEAMCAGLPIVTSDAVGAAADLVHDGENGLIYPAGDVDALAARLRLLVDDPGARRRMGARSTDIISSWNYDACVGSIVTALDRIRDARRPVSLAV